MHLTSFGLFPVVWVLARPLPGQWPEGYHVLDSSRLPYNSTLVLSDVL